LSDFIFNEYLRSKYLSLGTCLVVLQETKNNRTQHKK
jgi:hypothetical protein